MTGDEIYDFGLRLWSINRSITGEGVRETLKLIKSKISNLKIHSVKTGTLAFDWTVPKEWRVKEAFIITPDGKKICDFTVNNLHLVGYSIPYEGSVSLEVLQQHLHSLPDQPTAIPYVTSYYEKRWGFCISDEQRQRLKPGQYQVVVNTSLFDGELNYGEVFIKGETDNEIFLSTYICHPSMANNELSGPILVTYLAKWLQQRENLRKSYRIVFVPETIGSICYLSQNYRTLKEKVEAGFNVTCVGDERCFSFLPSRTGNTLSDQVAKHVLKWEVGSFVEYSWLDRGSDERQYCSPGIDLPIASIMRTKYGKYDEYHTSLDTFGNVVTQKGLQKSFDIYIKVLELLEQNKTYRSKFLGEPNLGKRGLYPTLSNNSLVSDVKLLCDFLSLCDGETLCCKLVKH